MAWNQPGGQNSQWGRRPGQGGDLDERVRSWQRKLESLLRPGGRGGESASLLATVGMVALALWLASGFFEVKAAERGVILRFGKLVGVHPQGLGWRWPWPIETITKVNVASVNSTDYEARVLTSDVNLVELRYAVQYQLTDPIKYLFNVHDPEGTLSEVAESAMREIVGHSTLDGVLVGSTRPQITERARDLIQRTLDSYDAGITITSVNLTDVDVPEPVIPSQRDANKALADEDRTIKDAQAYASSIIPAAQGQAASIAQDAKAYQARVVALAQGEAASFTQILNAYNQAPEVTRQRMYMDTIESILARSHKVLIDSKAGSGGNVFYLPLDKLLEKSAAHEPEQPQEGPAAAVPKDSDSEAAEARGRGER